MKVCKLNVRNRSVCMAYCKLSFIFSQMFLFSVKDIFQLSSLQNRVVSAGLVTIGSVDR